MAKKEFYFPVDTINTEEDFNEWFISCMMRCSTIKEFADRIGYIITDEYILDGYIIPYTEWSKKILENATAETICYWYALRLLYLYIDTEKKEAAFADNLYEFLDGISL